MSVALNVPAPQLNGGRNETVWAHGFLSNIMPIALNGPIAAPQLYP
jgi:hypothetical protein